MTLEKIVLAGRDTNLQQKLQTMTEQLYSADCISDLYELASAVEPDLIVLDSTVARTNVWDFLKFAKNNSIATPVVVAEKSNSSNTAKNMQLGAFDCINGGKDSERLSEIITRIKTGTQTNEFFSENCPVGINIVGKSKACENSLNMIKMVAKSNCNPILIIGETGTGKEIAAKAVHQIRCGNGKPFVAINCAALTANLLESELFGHVKGAFTGADKEKIGLLELADDGTVFLDEISEMPLELQAKLLRIIQEKNFRKVGGTNDITCKATIIASSNRNILKEVERGNFRRDLYYRLAVCPITLASLRSEDRKDDIALLAKYFIMTSDIYPEKSEQIKGMTKLAVKALINHNWPGNVRELKNVIDRAILLESSDKIGLNNLILSPESVIEEPETSTQPTTSNFSLEKAEKELIARALEETGWQKTRAASMLGITRATLYAKVKQYNIEQPAVAAV